MSLTLISIIINIITTIIILLRWVNIRKLKMAGREKLGRGTIVKKKQETKNTKVQKHTKIQELMMGNLGCIYQQYKNTQQKMTQLQT